MAQAEAGALAVSPSLRLSWRSLERTSFWACVLFAGCLMWLAPRPPAIDLAQHAGQIALWRDLIRGGSPWSGLVFINLLTPYLIGYGSALPLSFVMPVHAAIAMVLTAAFYAFVAGCVAVRRELQADARLDWLFLPSFFGFNWQWGFFTFLTAAPVLMFFLLFALRHRRAPNRRRGAAVVVLGVALLFSHGLLFLFGMFASGLILIGPLREPIGARAARLAPLITLAVVLALFSLATHERGTAPQFGAIEFGTPIWLRPISAVVGVSSDNWDPDPILAALVVVAMATPFFIGVRFNRGPAAVLFAALAATYLLVPAYALQTGYLFARFSLFLPAFFAFLFRPRDLDPRERSGERAARAAMALACVAGLCVQGWRQRAFAAESASFTAVERAAAPGKRALGLIFDAASPAARAKKAYVHFAAWYQADRGGFVDYNFANLPPQVVRFRAGAAPAAGMAIVGDPDAFSWSADDGSIYDYFFFRGERRPVAWLRSRSPCAFRLLVSQGEWSLVARTSCPKRAATGSR